jgi:hypothetical protein
MSRPNPNRTWVYHYTGTVQLRGIVRDRRIRASPTRLYRDLARTEVARVTEPIVWLSSNPIMEMTTYVKLAVTAGRLPADWDPVGTLCRVAIPYGYAGDQGLGEYTEAVGIPHADWRWNIRTGEMAGSNYTTWRIVRGDVPLGDCDHAEWLSGAAADGPTWEPWPLN